ncbi:MAG: uridine phosphorylase [Silvanigrellales bacterium]|nr:uridine phosphorylase [Silvanigrellales bacterium]
MTSANEPFVPEHMNAEPGDFSGNGGRGRFVLMPGSDGRAAQIAERFDGVQVKRHPRCHNLYLGSLSTAEGSLDVACISTGMGGASLDIIANELYALGARRFLRIGTAGSLQPEVLRTGAVVVPTASVRDESTSLRYLPVEIPATPSVEVLMASHAEAQASPFPISFGVIHTKDSLHAREFGAGPMAAENGRFMELLRAGNVLASEMECAQLFTLRALWERRQRDEGGPQVQAGAVLAIVGDDAPFAPKEHQSQAIQKAIDFALRVVARLEGSARALEKAQA